MKLCGKPVDIKEAVVYTLSSLLSTAIDYAVYLLVLYLLRDAPQVYAVAPFGVSLFRLSAVNLAYSAARAVSAIENFWFNNHIVFRQNGKPGIFGRLTKYMLVALLVALLGNFCIAPLHRRFGIDPIVAKLITDVTVFVVSYFGQKIFVFRKQSA